MGSNHIQQFAITESQHIEFRVEAFNLTNSVRFYLQNNGNSKGNTNLQLGTAQFGSITQAASTTGSTATTGNGGRILQLALKYVF